MTVQTEHYDNHKITYTLQYTHAHTIGLSSWYYYWSMESIGSLMDILSLGSVTFGVGSFSVE